MKASLFSSGFAVACFIAASGCAHRPSAELVQARNAYKLVVEAHAVEEDPTAAYLAGRSLQRAEHEFELHGNTQHARSLAYVATRKAERTAAMARTLENEKQAAERERAAKITPQPPAPREHLVRASL